MRVGLIILIVIVGLLVILEVGLRLILGLGNPLIYIRDQQIGYLLAPNQRTRKLGNLIEINSEFDSADDSSEQLCLNQKQELTLIDSLEPDRVIHLLLEAAPHLERNLPPDRYGFVVDKIRLASSFGITSTVDFSLYCMVALLCGTSFEQGNYWSEALDQIRSQHANLAQIVANYPGVEI